MNRRTSGWVLAMTVLLVSACGGATDSSDTVETTVETTPTTAGAAAEETTTVAETTMAPETTEAPDTTRSDPYDYGGSGDSTTSSSSTSTTPDDDDDDDGATGGGSLVVSEGEMGSFLTTSDGWSLYLFVPDEQGESTCYDDCEGNWPPLTGDFSAGEGVDDSLLGTTTRENGSEQVTYNDWPLYFFANDAEPGDTNGQGVGDVWYLVTPDGEQLP